MPKFRGKISDNNQLIIDIFVSPKSFTTLVEAADFKALIDTGATNTAISKKVVDSLQLLPKGKKTMISASHKMLVDTYNVYVAIPITEPIELTKKIENYPLYSKYINKFFVNTTGMPGLDKRFDILLGMDILNRCLLIVDNGQFTLAF